ncbi:hypothetical protein N8470_00625 [bacterium]|nr:hypothetical protein [bacterium]
MAGKFTFDGMKVYAYPDSLISLELEVTGTESYGNNLNFVDNKKSILAYVRPCDYGEFYSVDLTCGACEIGTFNLQP